MKKNNKNNLDPRVQASLESLIPTPERDPQSAARGRANFMAEAESIKVPVSSGAHWRLNAWIASKTEKKQRRSMLVPLTSLFVALIVALSGAGATVYAAQESLPDEFLYPVKTFSEDIQLALNNDEQTEIALLEVFTERRLDEMDALISENEPVPTETIARLQLHMNSILNLTSGLEDDNITQIQAIFQQHEHTLFALQAQNPEQGAAVMKQMQQILQPQQPFMDEDADTPKDLGEDTNSAGNGPHEAPEQTPMNGNNGDNSVEEQQPLDGNSNGAGNENGSGNNTPQTTPGLPLEYRGGPGSGGGGNGGKP